MHNHCPVVVVSAGIFVFLYWIVVFVLSATLHTQIHIVYYANTNLCATFFFFARIPYNRNHYRQSPEKRIDTNVLFDSYINLTYSNVI